jgi:hypothetical protein
MPGQQHLLPFEPLFNFSRAEKRWNIAISMLHFFLTEREKY